MWREKTPTGLAAAMIMLVIYTETEHVFLLFQLFKQVLPVRQVIIILWNPHSRKMQLSHRLEADDEILGQDGI